MSKTFQYKFKRQTLDVTARMYVGSNETDDPTEFVVLEAMTKKGEKLDINLLDWQDIMKVYLEQED